MISGGSAHPVTSSRHPDLRAYPGVLRLPDGGSVDVLVGEEMDDFLARALVEGSFNVVGQPHWALIRALLPPNGVFLDLGAHLGIFALTLAAAGHHVIAVEPHPRHAELLRASASANGLTDLQVVEAAVGEVSGSIPLVLYGPWSHARPEASVEPALVPAAEVINVRATTVDELLADLGIQRVDLVKMDLEGSEVAALRGMTRLLQPPESPSVVYERNADMLLLRGSAPAELRRELASLGNWIFTILPGTLVAAPASDFEPRVLLDELAIKRIPAGLPGWRVRLPCSAEEIEDQVLVYASSDQPALRRHVARELRCAPAWLLQREAVQDALRALSLDREPTVAAAAAWWRGSPPRIDSPAFAVSPSDAQGTRRPEPID